MGSVEPEKKQTGEQFFGLSGQEKAKKEADSRIQLILGSQVPGANESISHYFDAIVRDVIKQAQPKAFIKDSGIENGDEIPSDVLTVQYAFDAQGQYTQFKIQAKRIVSSQVSSITYFSSRFINPENETLFLCMLHSFAYKFSTEIENRTRESRDAIKKRYYESISNLKEQQDAPELSVS